MGLDAVSQTVFTPGGPSDGDTQVFLYDGHGSTRQLAGNDESILEVYAFDAYGVNLNPTPSPMTSLLYAGEHYDSDAQHYYNRARWYNPSNGRFNRVDPFAGNNSDPQRAFKLSDLPIYLPSGWERLVHRDMASRETEAIINSIKRSTPLGNNNWIQKTVKALSLQSTFNKRGRPMKES